MSSEVTFEESSYLHVRISFLSSKSLFAREQDSLFSVERVEDPQHSDSGFGFVFSAVLLDGSSSTSTVLIFSELLLFTNVDLLSSVSVALV